MGEEKAWSCSNNSSYRGLKQGMFRAFFDRNVPALNRKSVSHGSEASRDDSLEQSVELMELRREEITTSSIGYLSKKKTEEASSTPSVIARLMGLSTLPVVTRHHLTSSAPEMTSAASGAAGLPKRRPPTPPPLPEKVVVRRSTNDAWLQQQQSPLPLSEYSSEYSPLPPGYFHDSSDIEDDADKNAQPLEDCGFDCNMPSLRGEPHLQEGQLQEFKKQFSVNAPYISPLGSPTSYTTSASSTRSSIKDYRLINHNQHHPNPLSPSYYSPPPPPPTTIKSTNNVPELLKPPKHVSGGGGVGGGGQDLKQTSLESNKEILDALEFLRANREFFLRALQQQQQQQQHQQQEELNKEKDSPHPPSFNNPSSRPPPAAAAQHQHSKKSASLDLDSTEEYCQMVAQAPTRIVVLRPGSDKQVPNSKLKSNTNTTTTTNNNNVKLEEEGLLGTIENQGQIAYHYDNIMMKGHHPREIAKQIVKQVKEDVERKMSANRNLSLANSSDIKKYPHTNINNNNNNNSNNNNNNNKSNTPSSSSSTSAPSIKPGQLPNSNYISPNNNNNNNNILSTKDARMYKRQGAIKEIELVHLGPDSPNHEYSFEEYEMNDSNSLAMPNNGSNSSSGSSNGLVVDKLRHASKDQPEVYPSSSVVKKKSDSFHFKARFWSLKDSLFMMATRKKSSSKNKLPTPIPPSASANESTSTMPPEASAIVPKDASPSSSRVLKAQPSMANAKWPTSSESCIPKEVDTALEVDDSTSITSTHVSQHNSGETPDSASECSGEKCDQQPSPVSVLDQIGFLDVGSSPKCPQLIDMLQLNGRSHVAPSKASIGTSLTVIPKAEEKEPPSINIDSLRETCHPVRRPDLVYIRDVLLYCGFSDNASKVVRCFSTNHGLNPNLFERIERAYNRKKELSCNGLNSCCSTLTEEEEEVEEMDSLRRKVLFDMVDECLLVSLAMPTTNIYPWMNVDKPTFRFIWTGKDLLQQIWEDMNSYCSYYPGSQEATLEELAAMDIYKASLWEPSGRDLATVGVEVERVVFNDLLDHLVSDLFQT